MQPMLPQHNGVFCILYLCLHLLIHRPTSRRLRLQLPSSATWTVYTNDFLTTTRWFKFHPFPQLSQPHRKSDKGLASPRKVMNLAPPRATTSLSWDSTNLRTADPQLNCLFASRWAMQLLSVTVQRGNAEMYRRSGLVISREQGLRYDAGFAVPVLMS